MFYGILFTWHIFIQYLKSPDKSLGKFRQKCSHVRANGEILKVKKQNNKKTQLFSKAGHGGA